MCACCDSVKDYLLRSKAINDDDDRTQPSAADARPLRTCAIHVHVAAHSGARPIHEPPHYGQCVLLLLLLRIGWMENNPTMSTHMHIHTGRIVTKRPGDDQQRGAVDALPPYDAAGTTLDGRWAGPQGVCVCVRGCDLIPSHPIALTLIDCAMQRLLRHHHHCHRSTRCTRATGSHRSTTNTMVVCVLMLCVRTRIGC